MFVTKIRNVLAGVLVVVALAGATGLSDQTQVAEQPRGAVKVKAPHAERGAPAPLAKPEDNTTALAEEKPVRGEAAPLPPKTDRESMAGNWFIVNDDSQRKGEMWVITEDSILMYAKHGGANAVHYAHRLDASKNPMQIDITVSRIKGPTVGVIKGIYIFDGDELRLCLGELGKDRPAAFPEKPRPGEVLVLQRIPRPESLRATSGATPPKAKDVQPQQKVLTPEEAIKLRSKENVTVQFRVAEVKDMSTTPGTGFGNNFILLQDGGNFSVELVPPAMHVITRLDIDPVKHFTGKVVRVTGVVQPALPANASGKERCWITVNDLQHLYVVPQ